jgi:hypothetical protein
MAMLHRVEMNVINVGSIVLFITDRVVPKATLPYPTFTPGCAAHGKIFAYRQPARKPRFQHPPAAAEIGIVRGQRPNRMEVLRQNNDRVDAEWVECFRIAERSAQQINVVRQQRLLPVRKRDREKEDATRLLDTAVAGHAAYYAANSTAVDVLLDGAPRAHPTGRRCAMVHRGRTRRDGYPNGCRTPT